MVRKGSQGNYCSSAGKSGKPRLMSWKTRKSTADELENQGNHD